jgi:acyl-CoA synthetase (AMP-forming)/AMP-acid ligase II
MYRCSCSQAFLTLLVLSCLTLFFLPGSTGKPKGVVINHRQIVAACAAGDIALGIRQGEDVYLAYLPLAHIMELMAQFVMIAMGCTLCYADPKSLTASVLADKTDCPTQDLGYHQKRNHAKGFSWLCSCSVFGCDSLSVARLCASTWF